MAIPDESQTAERREETSIAELVRRSGLPRDFVIWYLYNYEGSATRYLATMGGAGEGLSAGEQFAAGATQLKRHRKELNDPYEAWLAERAKAGATPEESAEAYVQGGIQQQSRVATSIMDVPAGIDPWGRLYQMVTEKTTQPSPEEQAAAQTGAGGSLIGNVADVFSSLTPEQLEGLGVGEISEKFGLQRLAIEDPEAFLQAMFDKSGITPSPPVYGFLRDLMPSITLLASTREGQDLINSPGGAVQLNKAINEVISQGYPSKGSILEGLAGLGGLGRALLGEGQFQQPRDEFRFIAATLNDLIGPTMSQPLRQALFNTKTITLQGDRFLSASARGMYKGSFVDWLKDQGYPLPNLPAYSPTPGATEGAGAGFVEATTGGIGATPTGTPAFQVKGGIYEGE